jgi:predicted ATPase
MGCRGRPCISPRAYYLVLLAEAYGKAGQAEDRLTVIAKGLATAHKTGECYYEAELYRLKGELTLKSEVKTSPNRSQVSLESEVEACFQKAIEIARRRQAKSWELRAVMSLSRLWQQQGKKDEARQILAEIYSWFTEGFETKDLQEAQALLSAGILRRITDSWHLRVDGCETPFPTVPC